MKRLLVLLAIAGCVLFTAASHAEEMKSGGMMGDHMKHGGMKSGGMNHDMMMAHCKQEMVDMKMPPTTTKEQNDKMMEYCMQRLQREQNEKKGGGK